MEKEDIAPSTIIFPDSTEIISRLEAIEENQKIRTELFPHLAEILADRELTPEELVGIVTEEIESLEMDPDLKKFLYGHIQRLADAAAGLKYEDLAMIQKIHQECYRRSQERKI